MRVRVRKPHRCDSDCVCHLHDPPRPLLFAPYVGTHACADPSCQQAHGIDDVHVITMLGPTSLVGRLVAADLLRRPTPTRPSPAGDRYYWTRR